MDELESRIVKNEKLVETINSKVNTFIQKHDLRFEDDNKTKKAKTKQNVYCFNVDNWLNNIQLDETQIAQLKRIFDSKYLNNFNNGDKATQFKLKYLATYLKVENDFLLYLLLISYSSFYLIEDNTVVKVGELDIFNENEWQNNDNIAIGFYPIEIEKRFVVHMVKNNACNSSFKRFDVKTPVDFNCYKNSLNYYKNKKNVKKNRL